MYTDNDRFLIHFFRSFTTRQLFFGFWAILVAGFVGLIVGYYRKTMQRNFKEDQLRLRTLRKPSNLPVESRSGSVVSKGDK